MDTVDKVDKMDTVDTTFILLVEDNPDDEALMMRALRRNNVANDVVVARDGAEALDLLFGSDDGTSGAPPPPLPGLVLLDLKLPKVSGLEVLKRIRDDERTCLVPIVILTASREERDVAAGYRSGANAYVRKPVSFEKFAEAVRLLGLFWLMLNEPPPTPLGHLRLQQRDRRAAGSPP